MSVYERLAQLRIELPQTSPPLSTFVMCVQTGSLVFVSGHIARKAGAPWVGQLGGNASLEEGQAAARSVAIDLLGTLHAHLGDLNRIVRLVKVLCLVNSAPTFTQQHLVANGCSELPLEALGDKGRHARSAVGVAQLPFGVCVEIEAIAEVASDLPSRD